MGFATNLSLLQRSISLCACRLTMGSPLRSQDGVVGSQAAAIHAYVRNGGGVVNGAQAWYWGYEGRPSEQHPSNILLAPVGILVSGEIESQDYTFTSKPPSQLGNSELALTCLTDTFKGNTSSPFYLSDDADLTAATGSVNGATIMLSFNTSFWTKLQQVRREPQTASTHPPTPTLSICMCLHCSSSWWSGIDAPAASSVMHCGSSIGRWLTNPHV